MRADGGAGLRKPATQSRVMRLAGLALLALALPADVSAWWNASWKLRRKVYFKSSTLAEDLTSFPVLVRLDSTRVEYFRTQDVGQDIRFVDADDTTQLAHEIEKYARTIRKAGIRPGV